MNLAAIIGLLLLTAVVLCLRREVGRKVILSFSTFLALCLGNPLNAIFGHRTQRFDIWDWLFDLLFSALFTGWYFYLTTTAYLGPGWLSSDKLSSKAGRISSS
jgi:hypothetical protein